MDKIRDSINNLKEKISQLKDNIYSNSRNLVICIAIMLVFVKTPFVFWLCASFNIFYFMSIISNLYVYNQSKRKLKEYEKLWDEYIKQAQRKKSYDYSDGMKSGYTNWKDRTYNDKAYEDMLKDLYEKLNERAYRNSQNNRQQQYNPYKSNEYENALKLFKLNDNSTEAEFKKKFRELSKIWHPDMFANDTKDNQDAANRNFQKLNNAYQVIKKNKGFN